jgi:8-oxo-(d)GTP phosphatase
MIIFINDIPVRIYKQDEQPDPGRVNYVIDAEKESITQAKLINHVLIRNVSEADFDLILGFLNSKVPTNVLSIFIAANNYEVIKSYLRSKFKIVKAAGGLIRKKDKFLMIYRLKKWDLPKGKKKKKKNTNKLQCAKLRRSAMCRLK